MSHTVADESDDRHGVFVTAVTKGLEYLVVEEKECRRLQAPTGAGDD